MRRNKPLKSKTPLLRKKPMRKVSAKQAKVNAEYSVLRIAFLQKHERCELCGALATQVHHKRRRGIFTLQVDTWMPCCFFCHQKIEENGQWSRANGYIID